MTITPKEGLTLVSIAACGAGVFLLRIISHFSKYNKIPGQDDWIDHKFRTIASAMLLLGNAGIIIGMS